LQIQEETEAENSKEVDHTQITWEDYFKEFSTIGEALEHLREKETDQKRLALQTDSTSQPFFSHLIRKNKKELALNVLATLENRDELKQLTHKLPKAKKNQLIKILEGRMDRINRFLEEYENEYLKWSEFEKKVHVKMLIALHQAKRINLDKKKDRFELTYMESLENSLEFAFWEEDIRFYKGAINRLKAILKKN